MKIAPGEKGQEFSKERLPCGRPQQRPAPFYWMLM
jgi:hypothetical protein